MNYISRMDGLMHKSFVILLHNLWLNLRFYPKGNQFWRAVSNCQRLQGQMKC